ncbi:tetratricopeptide repeat protein [Burkholderia sp. Ap-962]|uniref:tetratricopeptide repeat protein n=1 Tax=Burkholderia sp. Ap-962 TaxID=2608333 RepID=UPI00142246A0|nr:tetratricopeptide repeat protein [Burkholderia sp. Ap-962]NIF70444.1 tetratricopeptide repeat protein [Burkholderia sp. Ap-962]
MSKKICLIFLCCFIFEADALAASEENKIVDDFEGIGKPGYLRSELASDGLIIRYSSSSLRKTLSYRVKNFDECSMMGMYLIPHSKLLTVDGSCSGSGGQIYRYIYRWDGGYKNWCLIRQVNGEKSDVASGKVVPTEEVFRVSGCAPIGEIDGLTYESKSQVKRGILDEMKSFEEASQTRSSLEEYISSIPDFQVAELAGNIDSVSVEDINNLAFYLGRYKRSSDAVEILQSLVKRFPDRAVARLNLADAYWDIDAKDLAVPQYQEYNRQMNAKGLSAKIPPRSLDRVK